MQQLEQDNRIKQWLIQTGEPEFRSPVSVCVCSQPPGKYFEFTQSYWSDAVFLYTFYVFLSVRIHGNILILKRRSDNKILVISEVSSIGLSHGVWTSVVWQSHCALTLSKPPVANATLPCLAARRKGCQERIMGRASSDENPAFATWRMLFFLQHKSSQIIGRLWLQVLQQPIQLSVPIVFYCYICRLICINKSSVCLSCKLQVLLVAQISLLFTALSAKTETNPRITSLFRSVLLLAVSVWLETSTDRLQQWRV